MTKKIISTLSDEELLKNLNNEDVIEIISEDNEIVNFISVFGLKPGKDLVSRKAIYTLYYSWSKERVSSDSFHKAFGKFFNKSSMNYKLSLSNLKISEASIKLLSKGKIDKTKSKSYKEHFEYFLKKYDISKGNHWVEDFILFHLYDKWTFENGKIHQLNKLNFNKFCSLYFEKKQNYSKHLIWFKINDNIFKYITQSSLDNLRKA